MGELQFNQSLKAFNTFGVDINASAYTEVDSGEELLTALTQSTLPKLILGGGSNLLLTRNLNALVIKNNIKGIKVIEDQEDHVIVEVGAGENWHELVLWSLDQGYGGLENLSLIPGSVGAAPIQNIGAYGVELADVFESLECIELASGHSYKFDKEGCQFGYRDSIFKRGYKNQTCITKVRLKLSKNPELNLSYGAIKDTLIEMGIENPTVKDVSNAVIKIRSSKLPDPALLGNSGSFFKNPELDQDTFAKIKAKFPNIVYYDLPNGMVKVPAAWLIEQCGWKGKRVGNTGCYEKQALVIVNYGGATGEEIFQHADNVFYSVKDKFGIELAAEVNIF